MSGSGRELRADNRADTMRDMRGGGYQRVEVLTGPGRRRAWDEGSVSARAKAGDMSWKRSSAHAASSIASTAVARRR